MKHFILFTITLFFLQPCFGQRRTEREPRPRKFVERFDRKIITEGYHINRKRTGVWNFYDFDRRLFFSGSYENDLKVGKWVYKLDGKIISELFYTNGKIDSVKAYHENGQLSYFLKYTDGNNGFAKFYYPSGNLKEFIPIKNGVIDGVCSFYFENGQLHRQVKFKNGKKYSVLKTFDLQGNEIAGGTLLRGTGSSVMYYLSEKTDVETKMKIHRMYNYEDGRMVALRYFHKNGQLKRTGSYSADGRKFVITTYSETGEFLTSHGRERIEPISTDIENVDRTRTFFAVHSVFVTSPPTASFQGGEERHKRFMKNSLSNWRRGGFSVKFSITATGEIEDIVVTANHSDLLLNAEVTRLIRRMPRWNPAFVHGVPIRTRYGFSIQTRRL